MAERSIKKQNFVHLLFHKKGVNKYLLRVLYFCVGCFALFAFAYLFTASDLFAWLKYGDSCECYRHHLAYTRCSQRNERKQPGRVICIQRLSPDSPNQLRKYRLRSDQYTEQRTRQL